MIKQGLAVLLGLALAQGGSGSIQPFDSATFAKIKERYTTETVLVLIWSLDCHHCKDGMARAASLHAKHPDLNLVLVNVDAQEAAPEVERIISTLRLDSAENWQFTDIPAPRLRATIDPEWYGELPRSYLIDDSGKARGFSGRVAPTLLEYWRQQSLNRDQGLALE